MFTKTKIALAAALTFGLVLPAMAQAPRDTTRTATDASSPCG